jgi:4-alpha-glucanotransferase
MSDLAGRRRAGLLIPLFSCPSTTSWGIGDIGDIAPMTAWLADGGQQVMQLLPINEMAPGQQSPYSAISAMAIDPIYICVSAVADFEGLGGEAALGPTDRRLLREVREAPAIRHDKVRRLKQVALRAAFERFSEAEWCRDTERARALKTYLTEQAWWIEDYAVFRALHAREGDRPWSRWPEPLQRRDPAAIARARRELAAEVLYYQYLQWLAAGQWSEARARAHGVQLFGDLPFMVDGDSADVWARQHQFRLDASVGVPPDDFSATGQDWGVPVYRWDIVADEDFRWLRERARRSAELFDGYRIDHLVGFYRTYGRPRAGGDAFFTPPDEGSQTSLGERVVGVFRDAGAEVIAEDLGTVPDFVRASLTRLGVPGFRVLRWERQWHTDGQPFRDPSHYLPASVATSGTHDTDTLAVWWESAPVDDRRRVSDLPTVQRVTNGRGLLDRPYVPDVRDALLESLFASGSNLVLLPVQDVFGWRDRINEPALVSHRNWTFRLPWACDRLDEVDAARERQATLGAWAQQHGRV